VKLQDREDLGGLAKIRHSSKERRRKVAGLKRKPQVKVQKAEFHSINNSRRTLGRKSEGSVRKQIKMRKHTGQASEMSGRSRPKAVKLQQDEKSGRVRAAKVKQGSP
jgi:hypothetical protein